MNPRISWLVDLLEQQLHREEHLLDHLLRRGEVLALLDDLEELRHVLSDLEHDVADLVVPELFGEDVLVSLLQTDDRLHRQVREAAEQLCVGLRQHFVLLLL